MKQLLLIVLSAASLLASNPDYSQSFRWTNRPGESTDGSFVISGAGRAKTFDNVTSGCVGWKLTYAAEGFSALSIDLQTSTRVNYFTNSYGPSGTWSTFGGTATTGSLPMTSVAQGTYVGYGNYPYVAVNVSFVTGTGSIDATLACWTSINYALGVGGGDGNATSINGGAVPASAKILGSNSSSQLIDNSTTFIYPCNSASGSASAYTCTTGYSITPTNGTLVLWRPDVACSLAFTLAVDGGAARGVKAITGSSLVISQCALFMSQGVLLAYNASFNQWRAVNTVNATSQNCLNAGSVIYTNDATDSVNTCDAQLLYNGTTISSKKLGSLANCSSAAAPAVCAAAAGGSVVVAAAGTTVTVNTTAVTANSQILVTFDSSLSTKLSVTCNTTIPALYGVTARTAATSFQITSSTPVTNPNCFSYFIIN